jgi:hypothetical protein
MVSHFYDWDFLGAFTTASMKILSRHLKCLVCVGSGFCLRKIEHIGRSNEAQKHSAVGEIWGEPF